MLFPSINLHVVYFHIGTFRSIFALLSMAVFGCSLIFYFQVMLFRYFLNDFKTIPTAPVITGTFVLILHMCPISIVRFLCFKTVRLLAGSNLYLLNFLCLLTDMFLVHYGVRFIVVEVWCLFTQKKKYCPQIMYIMFKNK